MLNGENQDIYKISHMIFNQKINNFFIFIAPIFNDI